LAVGVCSEVPELLSCSTVETLTGDVGLTSSSATLVFHREYRLTARCFARFRGFWVGRPSACARYETQLAVAVRRNGRGALGGLVGLCVSRRQLRLVSDFDILPALNGEAFASNFP